MGRVAERSKLSGAEYLIWEEQQPVRHEFFDGEVFAMAGGSLRHNALCASVIAALSNGLRGRGCVITTSDQRIRAGASDRYVYPDVSVTCGPVALAAGTTNVLANPTVLVEVLSSSTEQYDRGLKWEGYQQLASLADYVLVSQLEPRIEHFRRDGAGKTWLYSAAACGEGIVLSMGVALNVDGLFAEVLALPSD